MKSLPKALEAMLDIVLAYRPKPKTKQAKKRARIAKRQHAETRNQSLETS
jgi:hypothetical protein